MIQSVRLSIPVNVGQWFNRIAKATANGNSKLPFFSPPFGGTKFRLSVAVVFLTPRSEPTGSRIIVAKSNSSVHTLFKYFHDL